MSRPRTSVLVSDFDGTMTRHDFYKLAIESLIPPDVPDYWAEYRAGRLTHFEALRRYFGTIRAGVADVLAVVDRMEPDPQLRDDVEHARPPARVLARGEKATGLVEQHVALRLRPRKRAPVHFRSSANKGPSSGPTPYS